MTPSLSGALVGLLRLFVFWSRRGLYASWGNLQGRIVFFFLLLHPETDQIMTDYMLDTSVVCRDSRNF